MNTDLTNEQWFEAWSNFLGTIGGICKKKGELRWYDDRWYVDRRYDDKRYVDRRAARLGHLMEMLFFLLNLLRDELNQKTIYSVLDNTAAETGREAIFVTGAELIYVNEHYGPADIQSVEEVDEGIEAAKSVKDSIEKLLSFIPKHKALLHGLNELLSLGRAI